MTSDQIKTFREEFASIIYWYGMVKSQAANIRRLETYNKGGSHDNAIKRAIDVLSGYKAKLKEKLKGKSYEDWRTFSKNISTWNNKLNRSVNDSTKEKWRKQIENATFV